MEINVEDYFWTYCLNCKRSMFGSEKRMGGPPVQNMTWHCGTCGAGNVFRNSIQPVELELEDLLLIGLATCNGDKKEKNP
jgi:predicted nucleic-acid-binding Zn-ribbon protein